MYVFVKILLRMVSDPGKRVGLQLQFYHSATVPV